MTPLICPSCGTRTPRLTGSSGDVKCLKCSATIPAELAAPPAEGTGAESETASGPTPYAVEAYKPRRGGSPSGVILAVAVGLIGAFVLGAVAALIRQAIWFVLVFPLLFGFGVGACASAGAWLTKCRRTDLVAGAGVVAGLTGAFVLYYVSYLIAIRDFPQAPITFEQYLDLRCQVGVQLSSLNLGYTGSIIYYLAEVVVIVIAAGVGSVALLDNPLCEKCNLWKRKEKLGTYKINGQLALWAVGSGRPALVMTPAEGDERVTLEVYRCPHCWNAGPIEVKATCVTKQGNNTATAVVFVTYPGEAAPEFEELRTVS